MPRWIPKNKLVREGTAINDSKRGLGSYPVKSFPNGGGGLFANHDCYDKAIPIFHFLSEFLQRFQTFGEVNA